MSTLYSAKQKINHLQQQVNVLSNNLNVLENHIRPEYIEIREPKLALTVFRPVGLLTNIKVLSEIKSLEIPKVGLVEGQEFRIFNLTGVQLAVDCGYPVYNTFYSPNGKTHVFTMHPWSTYTFSHLNSSKRGSSPIIYMVK